MCAARAHVPCCGGLHQELPAEGPMQPAQHRRPAQTPMDTGVPCKALLLCLFCRFWCVCQQGKRSCW